MCNQGGGFVGNQAFDGVGDLRGTLQPTGSWMQHGLLLLLRLLLRKQSRRNGKRNSTMAGRQLAPSVSALSGIK
jgi:hypothetical protein